MLKIEFSGSYRADLRKLLTDTPDLKEKIEVCVKLFRNSPGDTRLQNHPLKKRLTGKWAFSITGDIRIIYKIVGKNTVRFLAIGGHRRVYRKING